MPNFDTAALRIGEALFAASLEAPSLRARRQIWVLSCARAQKTQIRSATRLAPGSFMQFATNATNVKMQAQMAACGASAGAVPVAGSPSATARFDPETMMDKIKSPAVAPD